jgi:hypothetical protein
MTTTTTTTKPVTAEPTVTEPSSMATTAASQLTKSLEKKSLKDLVRARTRRSLLLVDCSGSMGSATTTGERKIDALRKVVEMLRKTHPVPVAAFGVGRHIHLVDSIPNPGGSTPLHHAIDFGTREGANHLVVVTDGQPDSREAAFDAAQAFAGPIDVFYIDDGDKFGREFAVELARRTGGTAHLTDLLAPKELSTKIAGLLGEASSL